MSSIPAVVENEARANAQRAPREETRSSPETKFQDAIDSRRAARAHAAEKEARAHRSERASADRTNAPHEDHDSVRADDDDSRSASSDSASEPSSSARDASTARTEQPSATATRESEKSTRHAARASDDDDRAVSKDVNDGADESALAAAPTNANALEALLARRVPHADAIGGSSATAPGVAHVDAADSANDESADGDLLGATSATTSSANARASGDVTFVSDALRALTHAARDAASPSTAIDPRAAQSTSTMPRSEPSSAAADAPLELRATPAELPSVFDRLAVHIAAPERRAVVHLDPPELGRLSISLSLEPGGHVRADMRAQHAGGYAALESRASQLHASLIERGFSSASVNVSLGLGDPHSERSGEQNDSRKPSRSAPRMLADAEVRAMLPAPLGAIDMWA